jgi:hypothetical protein
MSVIEQERVEEKTVTEADVLRRAAYLYEEDIIGWCQGSTYSGRSSCMVGALTQAMKELHWGPVANSPTMIAVLNEAGFEVSETWWNLPDWNDKPGRTKEEVIAKLHEAAVIAS